jgi:hypothetical protein
MSTERTKQAIDFWKSREARERRFDLISDLALKAGLISEISQVPRIHFELMEYREYMITIQGLAKIRELRFLSEEQALGEKNKSENKNTT